MHAALVSGQPFTAIATRHAPGVRFMCVSFFLFIKLGCSDIEVSSETCEARIKVHTGEYSYCIAQYATSLR